MTWSYFFSIMQFMKINTTKIRKEMKRTGMTLEQLGDALVPKTDRRGAWYLIHRAKLMGSVARIATALGMDARDLIK